MTTIPTGWKLVPIGPTDDMIDSGCKQHKCEQGDSWYTAFELSEGDCLRIYAAMLAEAPAAPGVSTVEDAPAVAWMDPVTLDVISADRKAAWLSDYGAGGAAKASSYTRALGDIGAPAPAAGDAQEKFLIHGPVGRISHETLDKLLDPEWQMLRNEPASLWTTNSPPSRAVLEVYVRGPEGMIDAAIAAQRKGDA